MSSPNEQEKKLLDVSKAFDSALSSTDASKLQSLLADDATLHHDGLTLGSDLSGSKEIADYFKKYWEKYQYSHSVIAGAVHSDEGSAFSFWQDKDVKAKSGDHKPETTVGIWYHDINSSHKIKDIWFLRQLTSDEAERKLQKPIGQNFPVDPSQWSKSAPSEKHDADRAKAFDKAARTFNDIWKTGDPSPAKDIMTKDVKIYDPVFGGVTEGVESFENMIHNYAKSWKNEKNTVRVATTHSDKAFLWWQSTGSTSDGKKDTLYGINLLLFNDDNKIVNVVGFRQPTKSESNSKVKPEFQRA